MNERLRNRIVLAIVVLLIVGAGIAIATQKTLEGLDLKGGVSLIYQAKPTKQSQVTSDALSRTIEVIRERVDQLGVAEPEIQRLGSNQVSVSLPDQTDLKRAQDTVGTVAQMYFYDWEANLLNGKLRATPSTPDPNVGGVGNSTLSQYAAIKLASKRKAFPRASATTGTQGAWYGLDDKAKKVICGPDDNRADAVVDCKAKLKASANRGRTVNSYAQIKEGTTIVQAVSAVAAKPGAPGPDAYYVINDNPALTGKDVKNPAQNFDQSGNPDVTFDFTSHGQKVWKDVTKTIAHRGSDNCPLGTAVLNCAQHFAIVLDGKLITVPYIDFRANPSGIDSSTGNEITGGFTITSAQDLTDKLKSGALPLKLVPISSSLVSATLGQQALNEGLLAGVIGFIVVALFLLVYYRVLGIVAVAALVVYGAYFFALIKLIPITLTLPGIAGLILTLGVAADANIVIFERVKEEIRSGKTISAGIVAGYKRGIAAIADANFVTFITAFILFVLATADVKGFALTLGIGTLVSLFTAVLATQAVLGTLGRSRVMRSPAGLGAGETKFRWTFDFMGASKWFFSFSGTILLIGALAIGGNGLKFGIDFQSGSRIKAAFVTKTSESGVRSVLSANGLGDAQIQRISNKQLGNNAFEISTRFLSNAKQQKVTQALDAKFHIRGTPDTQSIGPTFGSTVAHDAVIAIIASLLVISVYIALRFEWKFAVPVFIALMHDLLITAGVYSLTGREVTTSTVAALLTILGYSLYDTIIVFDRVRENVPRMPRAAFSQIVNRSMSEVLTRSLATTFCTLLPVLALLLFGGDTLKDFAFALLVGVASGAYSSIFIASPVLTHWKEREGVYRRRHAQIAADNGGVVPAYAVDSEGRTVEVAPSPRKRPARSITAPELPGAPVSAGEFADMVRTIQEDVAPARASTAQERDSTADALPEDLVLKDDRKPKQRKPRNSRHGRNR